MHYTIKSRALKITRRELSSIIKKVLAAVSDEIAIPQVCEVHIMIINDQEMQGINREYRKKNRATDVLSFPQYSPKQIRQGVSSREVAGTYLGDLVISSDTTIRQAQRFGVTVKAELIRLIVHGVLHLIGYDHEKVPAREARAMRRREAEIRRGLESS
jgi:probable rRNA maturation factor